MKILCVTTYNNKLYQEYAHRFYASYNWPFDLKVYKEDVDFFKLVPSCKKFIIRNKHRLSNRKNKNYDYKFDAVRFCYKVYAYTHAIIKYGGKYDGIIGIDADSVFYKKISSDWVRDNIHKNDCMMTYLGRGNYHSEAGFIYWNLGHKFTRRYALQIKKMYDHDLIYKEKEFHDSYIFDVIRKKFEKKYNVKNYNIGDNNKGHVQSRSILGTVYDHTKGPRKKIGISTEFKGIYYHNILKIILKFKNFLIKYFN